MGFKPERTHYKLVFADPGWAGFEVVMTSMSMEMFVMTAALTQLSAEQLAKSPETIDRLFTSLADCLVSWNLDDQHDNPVPATKDGLYTQDLDFIMKIAQAWGQAVASVPDPLSADSSSGNQSLVESLTTEALSPSLPS
jgi:hypothetical protein